MKKKFYSQSTGGFYSDEFRAEYDAGGTWPADAVEISAGLYAELMTAQSNGKTISGDIDGIPFAKTPEPTPYPITAAAYLATVRAVREEVLNRISGIGFAALASGDSATAKAVVIAREALLDITKAPAVMAATDADSLKSAVIATYRAIVLAAPASIRSAFNAVSL